MSMTRVLAAILLIAALAGAGCGNNDTTPTSPSIGSSAFSDYFTDTISTGATKFYSFSVVSGGTVQITLGSLTDASGGAIVGASPTLSLGVPSGTTCAPTTSANVSAALSAQLSATLSPGVYCVSLIGNGGISADTKFAIRITQGTLTLKSTGSPVTFASNLGPTGSAVQTFSVAGGTAGNVTATLDSVTPTKVVGFGLGLWRPDLGICSLNQSVTSSGGAQLSATVDQGMYCVRVFDTGALTDFVAFSVTISHP